MSRISPLLFITMLLLPAALVVGCGGTAAPAETPRQVVTSFIQQVEDKDYSGSYSRLCAEDRQAATLEQWTEQLKQEGGIDRSVDFRIVEVETEEDESVVEVEFTSEGEKESVFVDLVLEDGAWKVSMERSSTIND